MKAALGILLLIVTAGGLYFYRDRLLLGQSGCVLSRVDADFNAIGSSLKTYKLNAGQYPTTQQGLAALVHEPTSPPLPRRWTKIADRIPNDGWNNPYQYWRLSDDDPRGFKISSAGKDGQFGTKDDLSSLDVHP
jgi:general secretion pathway protein G